MLKLRDHAGFSGRILCHGRRNQMNIKELFENMSDDFKKKAAKCGSQEEFEALIKEENIELTPEQVEAISGGIKCVAIFDCPNNTCVLDLC